VGFCQNGVVSVTHRILCKTVWFQ